MTAVDAFGDRDLAESVSSVSTGRDLGLPFSDEAIQEACSGISRNVVVYGGGIENRPALVGKIADGFFLAGNPPGVLGRVRDPILLQRICGREGIPFPKTLHHTFVDVPKGRKGKARSIARGEWLRKRCASGGGTGVHFYDGLTLPDGEVIQRYLPGRAVSVSFVACENGVELLGMSEQLVGMPEFGASGFKWCGNIMPVPAEPEESIFMWRTASKYARVLSRHFGLRGLNGIDMIQADRLYVVEVNARFTASMELLDSFGDGTLFRLHLDGCSGKNLRGTGQRPEFGLYRAKGVVYARWKCTAPETGSWIRRGWRDVPWPGDVFEEGNPVCTVFSEASDPDQCMELLAQEARKVYEELVPMEGEGLRHD